MQARIFKMYHCYGLLCIQQVNLLNLARKMLQIVPVESN